MKDPHIKTLCYRAEAAEGITFDAPPPVTVTESEFEGVLDSGKFIARMLQHFPTEAEARASVDPFLRAWEISHGINGGRAELHFVFDHSEIIDRAPLLPGEFRLNTTLAPLTLTGHAVTVRLKRKAYPAPPQRFVASDAVELTWSRYQRYKNGEEPLYSMAFACMTVIGAGARGGGRRDAASRYNIDLDVLNKLGDLSSDRGTPQEARKITPNLQRATSDEIAWLEAVVPALIRQVGIVEGGGSPAQLTMSDLPPV
jgi:hypothetical protein